MANTQIIEVLEQIENYLNKLGEPFRAKAYKTASTALALYPDKITTSEQLKSIKGVGESSIKHIMEFLNTGKVTYIEKLKNKPEILFTTIYGIGPKKAQELTKSNITSIQQLKNAYTKDNTILNDKQAIGLKYYEHIEQRIPRNEIEQFDKILNSIISAEGNLQYEIVGSYRRGASNSGDIDVILSTKDKSQSAKQQTQLFHQFLKYLEKQNIITHTLAIGNSKSLVIGQIPGSKFYRRIDFLYTTPEQFAFAILYFTGSKAFNTAMRALALTNKLSLNEHSFTDMTTKTKLKREFKCEKDIFDYLQMEYREPIDRIDGNSITIIKQNQPIIDEVESPKTNIEKFKKYGTPYLDTLAKQILMNMITTANHHYYVKEPIMTDNEYDILKEYIEDKYPDTEFDIGAPVPETASNKKTLPYQMPSMNKKKDEKSINQWFNKYPSLNVPSEKETTSYIISAKLDGVSAMFYNENGEQKLYTRGDGVTGQDISHMVPYLPQLEKIKAKKITIRGELLFSRTIFNKRYAKHFKNARNLTSGIVNVTTNLSDSENIRKYRDIDFICYEVVYPELVPSEQLTVINHINDETQLKAVEFKEKPRLDQLSQLLKEWRNPENYDYEIDGIIITHNQPYKRENKNPEHAFAFKMALTDQKAETFVTNVIYTASKDGFLKPRVQFAPITIGGAVYEFATGFNAGFIRDHNIGIGAKIEIIRSGDVIPYIEKVIEPAEQALLPDPETFKWNKTKVDILLVNPGEDDTVKEKTIEIFFKTMEIPNIGKGVAKQLVIADFDTPLKVIQMTKEDFLTLDGFKEKKADKIYNAIQDAIYTNPLTYSDLPKLMAATNLMGRGISQKTIAALLSHIPDLITSDYSNEEKIEMCNEVKGIQDKTCRPFVKNIPKFIKFIKEANLVHMLEVPQDLPKKPSGPMKDPHIITGFRSKELEDYLTQHNIPIGTTITKKTQVLYINSPDYSNSKTDKANELGIPIIVYTNTQELDKMLKQMQIIV